MTSFAAVLAALRTERDTLAARVAHLDEAIDVIEELNDETPTPAADKKPRAAPPKDARPTTTASDDKGTRILDALRAKSPQTPSELARVLKMPRPRLTAQLKPLLTSGAVVATGATMNRQFSLPPRSRAAKEAL